MQLKCALSLPQSWSVSVDWFSFAKRRIVEQDQSQWTRIAVCSNLLFALFSGKNQGSSIKKYTTSNLICASMLEDKNILWYVIWWWIQSLNYKHINDLKFLSRSSLYISINWIGMSTKAWIHSDEGANSWQMCQSEGYCQPTEMPPKSSSISQ